MEEGMILGRFIERLLRGWLAIVVALLACVGGATAYTLSQPTRYQAQALVATVRESTKVSLGSEIETLSEDELKTSTSSKERLQSFVVFVRNSTIAEAVLAEIGEQLPKDLRGTKRLLKTVSANVVSGSDTIEILVTAADPQVAALIANAWAKEYVRQLNLLYEGLAEASVGAVDDQVLSASETYAQRQAAVEAFLQDDSRDELNRLIADYAYLLESLSALRRSALYDTLTQQQTAYQTTLASLAEAQRSEVNTLIAELSRAESLLRDATDMRDQVRLGGEAAAQSNETALILLKTRVFAQGPIVTGTVESVLPATLDIQPDAVNTSAADMVKDLGALVTTLETRRDTLQTELQELAQALVSGETWSLVELDVSQLPQAASEGEIGEVQTELDQTIDAYQQKLNDARTTLAQEERRLLELESQRDLAWDSYDNLARKQAELAISEQTTGVRVRLAAPASVPEATNRHLVRNVGLAAVAGLLLGMFVAWMIAFWKDYRVRAARISAPDEHTAA